MTKYQNINLDISKLEEDYGEGVLKDYVRVKDKTKKSYVKNNYKTFMKTILGTRDYKMKLVKDAGRYSMYLLPMLDSLMDNNLIDINEFAVMNEIGETQLNRMISAFKKSNIIRKKGNNFYINPIIGFKGREIPLFVATLFEDELNKVGIEVK